MNPKQPNFMSINTKYWHLSRFNLSKKLNRDEMEYLSGHLIMKCFKKGERIDLNPGQRGDVYFIKSGAAKIIGNYDSGEEDIKYLVNRGEIFGILNLIEGENTNDCIVAIEDSLICIIDSETLEQMMIQNSNLNNHLFKLAGLRIQKLERKLEALIFKNAETRIKEFVTEYLIDFGEESGDTLIAKSMLSNNDIGKLTSTSRQTVNKVLNKLKSNGYIDFDKNKMFIKCENLA